MPILPLIHSHDTRRRFNSGILGMVWTGMLLAGCQSHHEQTTEAATPPVGHYEGSLGADGQAETRAALDIRHPSPGHYEAELTVAGAGTLSFVSDTIIFSNNQLRLTRPARPGQVLTLTLDGDFWRGTLALDSVQVKTILVKRGVPTPSTYRVEEVPQANGSAWLFAPADTTTPGAALALLPDASTAPTAAIWADALAREGLIVLLLPSVDSTSTAAETPRLEAALRFLRGTSGADTTNIGAWAVGNRATVLATVLAGANAPRTAFFITQNTMVTPDARAAFRELRGRKLPTLALYGGPGANAQAAAMRTALGSRRGSTVRPYRATGPDLLVSDGLNPRFGPGLPSDVVHWLQGE
ncbi:hypothetical protein [Hymenobacter negativus]|uniref:Uncharacterized protein n=1 Tax=Hymenobacter negativus TaxID=2795026 RepID=A0ABS3QHD0_9BACT|nr:hypothetical protein [Hymenobacter negativus]MBO2010194.1 hypothetical protein [Hymenobacter negativus]